MVYHRSIKIFIIHFYVSCFHFSQKGLSNDCEIEQADMEEGVVSVAVFWERGSKVEKG